MRKGTRLIPHFASDEESAEFWDTHSFADYIDDTEPADDVMFVMHTPTRAPNCPVRRAPVLPPSSTSKP